jgi:hypothetical protein
MSPMQAMATITVCASGCDHTTLAAAIGAATSGDEIDLQANISEGLVTVNKSVTIDGNGFTLTSTSATWGIQLAADNITIQDLTVDGAGTLGIITDPGRSNLALTNVTVQNGVGAPPTSGTGFAITCVSNVTLTNISALNNAGNGVSITDCSNVTINGITTSGNAFGGGFSAGIGVFSSGNFCTAGTDNVTVTGAVNIGEPLVLYTQDAAGSASTNITNLSVNPTSGSTPPMTHFTAVDGATQLLAPDLNSAYSGAAGLIASGASADDVHVEEIATGDKFVKQGIAAPAPYTGTYDLKIQAAVENAASGVTVNVEDGTYAVNSEITIDKDNLSSLGSQKRGLYWMEAVRQVHM